MNQLKHTNGSFFHKGDWTLFLLCVCANIYGLILIYSATRYTPDLHSAVIKQIFAMLVGFLAFAFFTFVDIELILERFWPYIAGFNVLFLLLLIPFGNDDGTGNKSWIEIPGTPFNIQPAEIVKLTFVLLIALQFSRLRKSGVSRPSSLLQTAGHTLCLCALIFVVSSDMGMALVYMSVFVIIAWAAGVQILWFLLAIGGVGGVGFLVWPHLPNYIQMRVMVVLDHSLDPLGKGFQQMRSLLAIGSGQLTGQGYLRGIQTQSTASSALPARHTDFIFSVAGEEFGLIGCVLILAILTTIIIRCIWIARTAHNPLCAYIAVGYAGMLAIQTALNVGMCLFVFPVVGLTLPFFSYGGSSLVALYIAMGILSGVKMRSRPSWLRDRNTT
ncbi:MAG: FtsW/RodA/SpoVE family cell cycle protein [Evtepia sp.]